jgi:DNA-binding CsgD family transcriptional regulator
MSNALSKKGNYREAFEYLQKYDFINDSLKGATVKLRIAELDANYKAQQKDFILKQSQLDLAIAKQSLEKRTMLIIFVLIMLGLGIWIWLTQMKRAKKQKLQSQKDLAELTRILLEKNTALLELEQKLLKEPGNVIDEQKQEAETESLKQNESLSSTDKDDFEKNLYNQRILTNADWASFKTYFEKAYPGYLMRLRNAHPNITEAEERKFLFIKLNFTTKESAAMMGISPDSVKKTRTRLRKRLELEEGVDLVKYIQQF